MWSCGAAGFWGPIVGRNREFQQFCLPGDDVGAALYWADHNREADFCNKHCHLPCQARQAKLQPGYLPRNTFVSHCICKCLCRTQRQIGCITFILRSPQEEGLHSIDSTDGFLMLLRSQGCTCPKKSVGLQLLFGLATLSANSSYVNSSGLYSVRFSSLRFVIGMYYSFSFIDHKLMHFSLHKL